MKNNKTASQNAISQKHNLYNRLDFLSWHIRIFKILAVNKTFPCEIPKRCQCYNVY